MKLENAEKPPEKKKLEFGFLEVVLCERAGSQR